MEQVEQTLALVQPAGRADVPGFRARLRREAAPRDRPRAGHRPQLLLLDEPLAGMSPRERVETVQL